MLMNFSLLQKGELVMIRRAIDRDASRIAEISVFSKRMNYREIFHISNPLSQIVTTNPGLQPDTHFAADMFPYKKTELFQKSGFKSKPPKKLGIYVF